MSEAKCGCGAEEHEGGCQGCRVDDIFIYYCKSCERSVAEKRCPYCGLKTQRKKGV